GSAAARATIFHPVGSDLRTSPCCPGQDNSRTPRLYEVAELGVGSCPSSIEDAGFFGALHESGDGRLTLLLPGRDAVVEDTRWRE
ncbi:hypothetical protein, partial [Streptomyces finlayi]|uniref:hypothetical protein n=1 Tax=Streptomyces finlayi TaxID=67296 RepID=UPI001E2E8BAB